MTGADRERLDASVRGRVQGVGFRYFVLREAESLGLDGFVANERDGSVRVVAEGPSEVLDALLGLLNEGPPASIVERVIHRREPARGVGPGSGSPAGSIAGTDARRWDAVAPRRGPMQLSAPLPGTKMAACPSSSRPMSAFGARSQPRWTSSSRRAADRPTTTR